MGTETGTETGTGMGTGMGTGTGTKMEMRTEITKRCGEPEPVSLTAILSPRASNEPELAPHCWGTFFNQ